MMKMTRKKEPRTRRSEGRNPKKKGEEEDEGVDALIDTLTVFVAPSILSLSWLLLEGMFCFSLGFVMRRLLIVLDF